MQGPRFWWPDFVPVHRVTLSTVLAPDRLGVALLISATAAPTAALAWLVDSRHPLFMFIAVGNVIIFIYSAHGSLVAAVRTLLATAVAATLAAGAASALALTPASSLPLAVSVPLFLCLLFVTVNLLHVAGVLTSVLFNFIAFVAQGGSATELRMSMRVTALAMGIGMATTVSMLLPPHWHAWQTSARAKRLVHSLPSACANIVLDYSKNVDNIRELQREASSIASYVREILMVTNYLGSWNLRRRLHATRNAVLAVRSVVSTTADFGYSIHTAGGVKVVETMLRLPVRRFAQDVRRRVLPCILWPHFAMERAVPIDSHLHAFMSLEDRITYRAARLVLALAPLCNGYFRETKVENDLISLRTHMPAMELPKIMAEAAAAVHPALLDPYHGGVDAPYTSVTPTDECARPSVHTSDEVCPAVFGRLKAAREAQRAASARVHARPQPPQPEWARRLGYRAAAMVPYGADAPAAPGIGAGWVELTCRPAARSAVTEQKRAPLPSAQRRAIPTAFAVRPVWTGLVQSLGGIVLDD